MCQVVMTQQVFAGQVKVHQAITQHVLTVKKHDTGKRYWYMRSVRIQEYSIDRGDRYEYRKMIQFCKIVEVQFSNSTQPSR